jgi:hypothetical protein
MKERNQNVTGAIALIIIIIVIIFSWLLLTGEDSDTEDRIILTPLDVTADPAAYTGSEIKVKGVIIERDQAGSSFIIMPIDIYLQCDRNPYCGEEYTHLKVIYQGTIPPIEHDVIVTGNLEKKSDETYELIASKIKDKGKI